MDFDEIASIYICKLTYRCYLEQRSVYDELHRIVIIDCLKVQESYGAQIIEQWDKCQYRVAR